MAKLKARKRQEIFRVTKVVPGTSEGVLGVRHYRALMSDATMLERMVLQYTPEEVAKNYGEKSHDYGWKVGGRPKAGKSLEEILKWYLERGWELVDASSSYFRRTGDSIESLSQEPFISAESAAKRSAKLTKSRTRASEARAESDRTQNGPGLYVTNVYTSGATRSRIADHPAPFASFEEAEDFAVDRLRHFTSHSFDYLLPVAIIESPSRRAAELNDGHVWWINGKYRGPAVDPRQSGFGF